MAAIRRIRASEGAALRDIRLRAIGDSPEAFAVSHAATVAQGEEAWTAWATMSAEGDSRVLYVATDAGRWFGLAGGMLDAPQQAVASLISMWVDPLYRGRGLGRQLVEHVAAWARHRGACRLELWVTEGNGAAIALYTRCGFRMSTERQPHPVDPTRTEQKTQQKMVCEPYAS